MLKHLKHYRQFCPNTKCFWSCRRYKQTVCKFELRCFTVNKLRIEYSQSGAFVLNFFLALNFCICFDFIDLIFLCFYYNLHRTVAIMQCVEVKHFTLFVDVYILYQTVFRYSLDDWGLRVRCRTYIFEHNCLYRFTWSVFMITNEKFGK